MQGFADLKIPQEPSENHILPTYKSSPLPAAMLKRTFFKCIGTWTPLRTSSLSTVLPLGNGCALPMGGVDRGIPYCCSRAPGNYVHGSRSETLLISDMSGGPLLPSPLVGGSEGRRRKRFFLKLSTHMWSQ